MGRLSGGPRSARPSSLPSAACAAPWCPGGACSQAPSRSGCSANWSSRRRHSSICRRTDCRSARAACVRRPCVVEARRIRSTPSAVLGPVLSPPCSRHRPFRMAGHWHGVPRRVLASHLGAREKSPGGFPCRSQPRRVSWGVWSTCLLIPLPLDVIGALTAACSHSSKVPGLGIGFKGACPRRLGFSVQPGTLHDPSRPPWLFIIRKCHRHSVTGSRCFALHGVLRGPGPHGGPPSLRDGPSQIVLPAHSQLPVSSPDEPVSAVERRHSLGIWPPGSHHRPDGSEIRS